MKNLSIILACILLALLSCTKSKEVHPELGDGNEEIVTVGVKDVRVEYTRTDHAELSRVVLHYNLVEELQFAVAEMTKRETFFELTLDELLCDTLYVYYYELFYNGGVTLTTEQKTFHTQECDTPQPPTPPTPPSGVPEGAINGLFTINENGDQLYFSQGNLQYQASTNTWRFAEHQWNYVGDNTRGNVYENGEKCDNSLVSSTYNGWIDMFGWGTSGYDHGGNCYQPWSINDDYIDYYAYGSPTSHLYEQSGKADWGYNAISNGGNQENLWRSLSNDEWDYLLNTRNTTSAVRFAKAYLNGVAGLVIVPDNWDGSVYGLSSTNDASASYSSNSISLSDWNDMLQQSGVVFLPAAGSRRRNEVSDRVEWGQYWTATYLNDWMAYPVSFDEHHLDPPDGYDNRFNGQTVRLVIDADNTAKTD